MKKQYWEAPMTSQSGQDRLGGADGDNVQFAELVPEPMAGQTSLFFKLTDECSAAINEAVVKKQKIRLHYEKDSCVFEIYSPNGSGELKRFDCTAQPMGNPMDAIMFDEESNNYRTISALNTRIQTRATDKTFAETREKAQKLQEEQQKHKAMDMTKNSSSVHRRSAQHARPATQSAALVKRFNASNNSASSSQKVKHAISIKPSNALAPSVLSTMKSAPVAAARPVSDSNRTMHRYMERPGSNNASSSSKPTTTESTKSPSSTTLPNSANTQRSLFSGGGPHAHYNSHNGAAPATSNNAAYSSLSATTTQHGQQTTGIPPLFPRKRPLNEVNPTFEATMRSSVISAQTPSPPVHFVPEKKRTANAQAPPVQPPTYIPAAESIPPIQPTETTPSLSPSSAASSIDSPNSLYSNNGRNHTTGGAKSLSSSSWRPSVSPDENINDKFGRNGSLTLPTKPSRDWSQVFGEIGNLSDAKRYHEIFSTEYPLYCEYYKALSEVANEFTKLEKELKSTPVNTPDHDKMEEMIQSKFAKYQRDGEFLSKRQKHTDLRAKLEILKQRIIEWESARRNISKANMIDGGSAAKYGNSGRTSGGGAHASAKMRQDGHPSGGLSNQKHQQKNVSLTDMLLM